MKKLIIGTLVGGLILFFWQFLSWSMLNIHASQMAHTPQQTQILDCLKANNLPEGEYFLPNMQPGATPEQQAAYMEKNLGHPWAQVTYKHHMNNSMGMNMFRGLVVDLLAAALLCYLLLGDPTLNFRKVMTACISIGLIAYMTIPYLNSIWFESNSIPDLVDALVSWGIVGVALGLILPSKENKVRE